jgi:hypothetical protein
MCVIADLKPLLRGQALARRFPFLFGIGHHFSPLPILRTLNRFRRSGGMSKTSAARLIAGGLVDRPRLGALARLRMMSTDQRGIPYS